MKSFKLRFHVPSVHNSLAEDYKKSRAAEYFKVNGKDASISDEFMAETNRNAELMLKTVDKWIKEDGTIHLLFNTEDGTVAVVAVEKHEAPLTEH